jgi:alcohol dehydrogenase/propanol-preferring alcohol dehydrogenase
MDSLKVTTFGQPLTRISEATPAPEGRGAIVKVTACGVCHSDVHLADGHFDLGGGRKVDLTRNVAPPRTLGHEIVGEVVALGPDVTARDGVAIGDRRVVYPWIGCGECSFCKAGDEHLCSAPRALGVNRDGGYATHCVVPDVRYLVPYEGLGDAEAATVACSGLTAYGALKKAKALLAGGGELLILGAGGVGLAGIRMAEAVTGRKPIVADIDPAKAAAAMAAGAKQVIDPSGADAGRDLARATRGGVAVAIDYVGAAQSFMFGFNALAKGGTVIIVGLFGGAANLPVAMIPLKLVSITYSLVGSLEDMREAMRLAQSGKLGSLPIQERPLADADDVLARLKAGQIIGRTILRP